MHSVQIQPASAPVIIDGEPEYKISQIVDFKIDCQQACKLLYKVIWLGYEDTGDESEWIPASEHLQLGHVSLLALHQVPEGLPDSSVLLHEFLECLFNGT